MKSIKDLLKKEDNSVSDLADRHKYVTKEYQDYGYRLAVKLDQQDKISLYIKLAKEKPRSLLDQAFSFAIDYPNAKNRGKLFMWKLKELEKERGDLPKKPPKKPTKTPTKKPAKIPKRKTNKIGKDDSN